MHDKLGCDVWETEVLEARLKEIPINIVKCFFKIQFQSHITLFLLGFSHEMNDFLQNNSIIEGDAVSEVCCSEERLGIKLKRE